MRNFTIFFVTCTVVALLTWGIRYLVLNRHSSPIDSSNPYVERMDLGLIPASTRVTTSLLIKNPKLEGLEINNLRGTCGCAVLGESSINVARESTISLPIQLNLYQRIGPGGVRIFGDVAGMTTPLTVGEIHFEIESRIRARAALLEECDRFLPGSHLSLRIWIEEPIIDAQAAIEGLTLSQPYDSHFEIVDAYPVPKSSINFDDGSKTVAIDVEIAVSAMIGDLKSTISLAIPTGLDGVDFFLEIPIEFPSGVFLQFANRSNGFSGPILQVVNKELGLGNDEEDFSSPKVPSPTKSSLSILATVVPSDLENGEWPSEVVVQIDGDSLVQSIPSNITQWGNPR